MKRHPSGCLFAFLHHLDKLNFPWGLTTQKDNQDIHHASFNRLKSASIKQPTTKYPANRKYDGLQNTGARSKIGHGHGHHGACHCRLRSRDMFYTCCTHRPINNRAWPRINDRRKHSVQIACLCRCQHQPIQWAKQQYIRSAFPLLRQLRTLIPGQQPQ